MSAGPWRSLLYRASNLSQPAYGRALREARHAANGDVLEARRFVDRKLCEYLRYCREYSPYWKERWPDELGSPTPENARATLAALPPLGKEDLREHEEDLRIRPQMRRSGDGFPPLDRPFPNWSGGSTGVPTRVWQDARWAAANRAAVDLGYRSVGLDPGRPTLFLWGSENELGDIQKSLHKRVSTWLRGLDVMPAFALDPARMERYAEHIDRRTEVDQAICFVSAVDTLTAYLQRERRRTRRLARVVTGGGTLTPELRERIRATLADEVYDMYGSRDLGLVAMETANHSGLACCMWHNYLELLDDEERPIGPGGSGRVHLTAIDNYAMALLRFDMGDIATLGAKGEMAWNAPVLRELSGRVAEHLIARDGSRIDPAAVIHLIGVVLRPPWLRKFQMVQEGPTHFRLRTEAWTRVETDQIEDLRKRVEESLYRICGGPVALEIAPEQSLEPSPSGKHQYTVLAWQPGNGGAGPEPTEPPSP